MVVQEDVQNQKKKNIFQNMGNPRLVGVNVQPNNLYTPIYPDYSAAQSNQQKQK